jgi:Hom_end-associated Hint/Homing endonuclease
MYYKRSSRDTKMIIQDVECYVPPPGFVFNRMEGRMEEIGIYSRSEKIEDQYWEIPPGPKDWFNKRKLEKAKQKVNPNYYDPELADYSNREWHRRLNGFWYMNNGNPTYITGVHYFYLCHWLIDDGYPDFRWSDLQYFYFWASCVEDPRCGGMINYANRRSGKCFAPGTMVRMFDGSLRAVEEIQEGERLMGPDSTPRIVSGVVSGEDVMYEITPNKGNKFVVNGQHILTMIWNGRFDSAKRGWKKDSVVNISVEEYLKLEYWEKDHLPMYRSGWGDNFEENRHFIDPYILGVWLGDGCSQGSIFTTADDEIISELSDYSRRIGLELRKNPSCKYGYGIYHTTENKKITMVVTRDGVEHIFDSVKSAKAHFGQNCIANKTRGIKLFKDEAGQKNPFRDELSRLGVVMNKHIPSSYMIDSKANRLQLLAGLLDTDGHLCANNGRARGYEIIQKRRDLSYQIAELSRSLGFYTSINEKNATMRREDGSIYSCKVYRIAIYGDIEKIPCKIERKKVFGKKSRVNPSRTGFSVKKVGAGAYHGFSVDKDSLFLLEDGVVVHNSKRGSCILYEDVSRSRGVLGGIQSKNDKDASHFFQKHVIKAFKAMRDFFVPTYDKALGKTPKSSLRFFATTKTGQYADEEAEDALDSEIDFREASSKAYDNTRLKIIIEDEFGKLDPEYDLLERHRAVLYCVKLAGKFIGKMLYMTTVEDMASGKNIEQSRKMFDDSNPADRMPNGQTKTSLYRFRLPAYETHIYDKYGMPRIEEARADLQAVMDKYLLEGDYVGYASERRKQPFSDEDIFRVAAKAPIFDIIKISEQLASISCRTESELYKRGNFVWQGGKRDTRVVFREMKNGRFLVRQLMEGERQNLRKPINRHRFAGGIDPFEQKKAARPSDGAAYIFKKFDQNSIEMSNSPIVEYCARPQPSVFFEDMVMMAVYYGCEVNIENNKTGLIDYFQERGYTEFLYWVHGARTAGTYASDSTKQQAYEIASNYISDDCDLVFFPRLLEDLTMFDLSDSTKYDRAMAFLWTMFSVGNQLKMSDIEAPPDVNDIVRTYKLRRA